MSGITLDTIDSSLHNIAISDGTDVLAINGDGSINATVTASDLDIRDLTHVSDSVKVGDGTDFLAVAADGSIAVTDNGASLTVDAVQLDIDDLDHSVDSVKIGDGTDFLAVAADGSIAITDNGGSLTVDAVQLDIDDLDHSVDSVKIGDGTDFLAVNADGSLNVQTSPGGFASWKSTAFSATSTAADVAATPLTGRLRMIVQNLGAQDVFLGESGAVTSSTGMKVAKGSSMEMDWDDGANVFAITASGTADLRISEYAA